MHLLNVWEHENLALRTCLELFVEAERLHNIDLLCLQAMLLIQVNRSTGVLVANASIRL